MTLQPSPIDSGSDILNWDELSSRCLGRRDLVERILKRFRDSLSGELQQLEQAYGDRDEVVVARIAHRIKGTSLTVSAHRLAHSAHHLQEMAASNFPEVEQALAEIRAEVQLVCELVTRRISEESS